MRNPERTREKILKKSGILFNTQGYKATSISNITDATGFTKGAIYKHFRSKDELERESLSHLSFQMFDKLRGVVQGEPTAGKKLTAIFRFFGSYVTDPPLKGGCPLLNVAIESDDTSPALRKEAVKMLNILRDSLIKVIENGIRHNQIIPGIDKEYYATLIIASLEGAIMMGKLRGDNHDIRRVISHLEDMVKKIEM